MPNLFYNCQTLQEKKQLVRNLVLNHVMDLHLKHRPLSQSTIYNFHRGLVSFVLDEAVCEIEKSDRVVILFEIDEATEGRSELKIKIRSLGELTWKDALGEDVREGNGLCLYFVFNGDDTNPYYLIYEDKMKKLTA